jgi:hypothetical protein
MVSHLLVPWPDPMLPQGCAITVQIKPESGSLFLHYELTGDLDALRLPERAAQPKPQDDLWRHTCFEAFLGDPAGPRYVEFNFSPSGCWAGYAFSRLRTRATPGPAAMTHGPICKHNNHTLTLEVRLRIGSLPWPMTDGAPLGLAAVLAARDGHLTYWALRHPRAKPDFHDRRGWIARAVAKDDPE